MKRLPDRTLTGRERSGAAPIAGGSPEPHQLRPGVGASLARGRSQRSDCGTGNAGNRRRCRQPLGKKPEPLLLRDRLVRGVLDSNRRRSDPIHSFPVAARPLRLHLGDSDRRHQRRVRRRWSEPGRPEGSSGAETASIVGSQNLLTMATLTWRPGIRAGVPRVSRARWWLYRIATAVAASFVAGALYPGCRLQAIPRVLATNGPHPPALADIHCPPWPLHLRIDMALTGILAGFVIAFIGARIDHMIVESRRARGISLLPSS